MAMVVLAFICFIGINLHHSYINFKDDDKKTEEKARDAINLFDTLLKQEKGMHVTIYKLVMLIDIAEIAFSLFMCYATYSITHATFLLPVFVIIILFTIFELKRILNFLHKISEYQFTLNPIRYMLRYVRYIKSKNYTFMTYYLYSAIGIYGLLNFLKTML